MVSLRTELSFQLTTFEPKPSCTYQLNRMKSPMRPLIPLVTIELNLTHPLQATSHLGPKFLPCNQQPWRRLLAERPLLVQPKRTRPMTHRPTARIPSGLKVQLRPHRPTARMLLSLKVQRHPSSTTWTKISPTKPLCLWKLLSLH